MTLEVRHPGITALISPSAECEKLVTGFLFTEGPLWNDRDGSLLFSDMPGDTIRRWTAASGIETFRQPSSKSNGLTWDNQGRLLACEHATSRVTRTETDGRLTVLASHHDDKELNSPNDIVVRRDGAIYFSDPTYGRMDYYGVKREQQLAFQGVYRIDPKDGALRLLIDDFKQPNGLCFSLDEKRLFVNDTEAGHIRVFDVRGDGALGGSRVWAEVKGEGNGAPDGMKIDAQGNVFCCGPGGIHVFSPDAVSFGVIRTPEVAANFAWGGEKLKSLYITASTSLYRLETLTGGAARVS